LNPLLPTTATAIAKCYIGGNLAFCHVCDSSAVEKYLQTRLIDIVPFDNSLARVSFSRALNKMDAGCPTVVQQVKICCHRRRGVMSLCNVVEKINQSRPEQMLSAVIPNFEVSFVRQNSKFKVQTIEELSRSEYRNPDTNDQPHEETSLSRVYLSTTDDECRSVASRISDEDAFAIGGVDIDSL
jgi:hypothetical protein